MQARRLLVEDCDTCMAADIAGNDESIINNLPISSDYCMNYCMNQPWLTISDCPVSARDGNDAKNKAVSATSCKVVNSPSTVSFSITFWIKFVPKQ